MNIKTNYKEVINEEKQGKELYFEAIPTKSERQQLKNNGYRWNNNKKCWYIKLNKDGKTNNTKKSIKNYLSVEVGDIFYSSWGYEQTNVDFFQVIALKGTTQVIIREVNLAIEKEEATSSMSADRSYNVKKCTPLKESVFIKDNEKGQTKKILGTTEHPYINLTSFANAYKYNGGTLYESWYY